MAPVFQKSMIRQLFIRSRLMRYNKHQIHFLSDKMCDQISDAVLDAHLKLDPDSKVMKNIIHCQQ